MRYWYVNKFKKFVFLDNFFMQAKARTNLSIKKSFLTKKKERI